jgi:hypothetical protein
MTSKLHGCFDVFFGMGTAEILENGTGQGAEVELLPVQSCAGCAREVEQVVDNV